MMRRKAVELVVSALVVGALALVTGAHASQPFLAWSQDRSLNQLDGAKTHLAEPALRSYLDKSGDSHVTLVFTQDDVTTEDLTVFSQEHQEPSFLEASHSSAASSMFVPDHDLTSLQSVLAMAPSSVLLDASEVSSEAIRDRSIIVVRLASHKSVDMQRTDATIERIVNMVDEGSTAPLTVVFAGISSEPTSRARRSVTLEEVEPQPRVVSPQLYGRSYVASRPEQRHEVALQWFTIPILSGIIVGLLFAVTVIVGTCGLMATQTMEQWPDPVHDKNLEVPQ